MTRAEVRLEGKTIDYAFALLFALMGLAPLLAALRHGHGLVDLQALASIPLAALASYSFVIRSKAKVPAYTDEILVPVLSYLSPLLVLNVTMAIPPTSSSPYLGLVAIPGLALSMASLLVLRRSFAVLPSVRDIVTRGPYRYIRHPLYLGEAIYVLGMMLLAYNLASWLLFIFFLVLMAMRVRVEERKLMTQEEYRAYSRSVRYRMVPLLY